MTEIETNKGLEYKGKDGITHINIHPKGNTYLGRSLSTFKKSLFVHPEYGPFYSIEGFMQYLKTGMVDNRFRYLSGYSAKQLGNELKQSNPFTHEEYVSEVIYAMYVKIRQYPKLMSLVIKNELPYDYYYLFGNKKLIIEPKEKEWLIPGLENITKLLKSGDNPEERYSLLGHKYANA